MPAQLDPGKVTSVATDMTFAFFKAIGEVARAEAVVKFEFNQLIEDLHSYNEQFQQGEITQRTAQLLISRRESNIPVILALRSELVGDAVHKALDAALATLKQAMNTTLKAAFTAFPFVI